MTVESFVVPNGWGGLSPASLGRRRIPSVAKKQFATTLGALQGSLQSLQRRTAKSARISSSAASSRGRQGW
jgi:hypothetical protein